MSDIQICSTLTTVCFYILQVLERCQTYLHNSHCAHIHAADSQEEAGKGTLHGRAALQRLLNLVHMAYTKISKPSTVMTTAT